ncbi:MAG TPA: hypothetical protein VGM77_01670 [Gemmatimonadales bacterium]|jgi:hypothetical protein
MSTKMRPWLAGLLLTVAAAMPLAAQRFMAVGVPDHDVLEFFQKFQVAIVQNNHAAVAQMVNYPLHVNRGAKDRRTINTPAALLRDYDAVFTPAIRQAVILERAKNLYANNDGVALQRGTIWLRGQCDRGRPPHCRVGVGTINLPPGK